MLKTKNKGAPMNLLWKGRFDSDEKEDLRLWQVIKSYKDVSPGTGTCFIGYDTDEGVSRNKGRVGTKDGPNAIRLSMSSFPNLENIEIYDMGNLCNKNLESAQEEFSFKVQEVLEKNLFPIGLGGGHDIVFGHYCGIRKAFPDKKIGIINFDTHLDMRDYSKEGTSGTSFKQILDQDENISYLIVGYKDIGNTQRLRNLADTYGVKKIPNEISLENMTKNIKSFIDSVDIVYVTFCMDVFDISATPGVSAPTVIGLEPFKGIYLLQEILKSKKVIAVDFAEVNPEYDIDNRTAKLAGTLAYEVLNYLNKLGGAYAV